MALSSSWLIKEAGLNYVAMVIYIFHPRNSFKKAFKLQINTVIGTDNPSVKSHALYIRGVYAEVVVMLYILGASLQR